MSRSPQGGNCVASSSQVISPMTAPSAASLHSVLRAALENLDVQIEEELTRYRRQQRLHPQTLRRKAGFPSSKLVQQPAGLQLPQFPSATEASPSVPVSSSSSNPLPVAASTLAAPETPAASSAQPSARPASEFAPAVGENHAVYTTPAVPPTEATQLAVLGAGLGAGLGSGLATDSLQPPDAEPAAPEDYLASSEELLRSISEEEPEQRAIQSDRLLDTLLTPLGVGSLLLLLLSSATLGYLVMNPASLGSFSAQKPGSDAASAPAQPSTAPEVIAAPSPDLAAKEFVDLNLNSLSTLPKPSPAATPKKPSPSPSPQAARQLLEPLIPPATNSRDLPAVAVPPAPALIAPAPAENPRPAAFTPRRSVSQAESVERSASSADQPTVSTPAPVAREATPRPEALTPAVAADSTLRRSNYYYVVTPYRSDSELNQVQQTVPDAYVRNFSDGASVQMGAFTHEAKAQERVQELQQQGIEAEVREME